MNIRVAGWGCVVIGLFVSSQGFLEISSGQFSPVGYNFRSGWIKPFLTLLFGQFAPYASAVLWLAIALAFVWFGIS